MTEENWNVSEENFFEVLVVGGGTCSLAICARLCESHPGSIYTEDEHQRFHWLKQRGNQVELVKNKGRKKSHLKDAFKNNFQPSDILVLDELDNHFLAQWDTQFSVCKIPYLRSPMFFHCDPTNIDGMVIYAHMMKDEDPYCIKKIENVVGREYSKHQLKKQMKKNMRKKAESTENSTHDAPGLIDINMRDWKDYYRPSSPFFRKYCQDIINRYSLNNVVRKGKVTSIDYGTVQIIESGKMGKGFLVETEDGQRYGCKICIIASGHKGSINYPIESLKKNPCFPEGSCHLTHLFHQEAEFINTRITQKLNRNQTTSVAIVGGGLSSAQLVDNAIQSGISKVYLILRGPLKVKHFDFHLDWVTKYKNVKKSAFYIADTDNERLEMIQQAREGGSVNPEYYKILLKHVKSGRLEILKYSTIVDTEWMDNETWKMNIEQTDPLIDKENENTSKSIQLLDIDYIYCATGISQTFDKLPFMQTIIRKHPIDFVQGFPCLTDNLQWKEDVPLFLIGKNASLRIGPSSANLDGARLGAERVGWYIQNMKKKGQLEWYHEICEYCNGEMVSDGSMESLDMKLDLAGQSESDEESENNTSSFETRLKLARGEMNWYSLLQDA